MPGVGRFWWADSARSVIAPYRGKVLAWENVYAGRDRTGQYNAQIELCGDGNFITRSNNVERVYRRVLSHDWDNDGLPNTIDPAPETPLVPSVWNQSGDWAAAAFPSNAAEIAAMGGYAAWVAARGADPDRRLVSLGVLFDDGSVWPTMLDFGGVPVMADGASELSFTIDCGARVPFTLTSGRLKSVVVTATLPPMRSGGGGTTISRELFPLLYSYPYERSVGDVTVHFDNPFSGWICRPAGVSIEPSWLPHFYPGDSVELTAEVFGCHSNAYFGCTWHGGAGITFSNPHSLSTTVTYDPTIPDFWATNGIVLVTQFIGYSLTNHVFFTVGFLEEPPLAFSLGCQEVFFLNDADFLEGECTSNRPERIRPVTLNLTGPLGTNGTARLSVQGGVNPVLFHVVNGVTNRVTAETEFPLAVTNDFEHTASHTVYVSCPNIGMGTITATFTPADGGAPLTDSVTFRCIEPLRKLVTTEKKDGRYVNPSRLVMGTNAVLKVSANGLFSSSEVNWHVVSGSAQLASDGWYATVTPTGTDTIIIEARFNEDEIQPQFVLPVVQPRTIPVKAFVVEPPENGDIDVEPRAAKINAAWTGQEIRTMLDTANEIFTQVGIRFELVATPASVGSTNDWNLLRAIQITNANGSVTWQDTAQFTNLVANYTAHDCVKVYFLGTLRGEDVAARTTPSGILMTRFATDITLAHELGHVMGLDDCYWYRRRKKCPTVYLDTADDTVDRVFFFFSERDWGLESGRGFYEKTDTRKVIMSKMLMYGVGKGAKSDIPNRVVISLRRNATTPQQTFYPHVGADHINQHNSEVYSR